jgi:hypothetical protein
VGLKTGKPLCQALGEAWEIGAGLMLVGPDVNLDLEDRHVSM